jgi:hypothetical protein
METLVRLWELRTKQNFYAVGSRGAWSGVGHFRELGRRLPVERVDLNMEVPVL